MYYKARPSDLIYHIQEYHVLDIKVIQFIFIKIGLNLFFDSFASVISSSLAQLMSCTLSPLWNKTPNQP